MERCGPVAAGSRPEERQQQRGQTGSREQGAGGGGRAGEQSGTDLKQGSENNEETGRKRPIQERDGLGDLAGERAHETDGRREQETDPPGLSPLRTIPSLLGLGARKMARPWGKELLDSGTPGP